MSNFPRVTVGLVLALALGASACSDGVGPQPVTETETFLSDAELAQRMFDCIGTAGFDGSLVLDGPQGSTTEFYVPPERQVAFDLANDECITTLLDAGLMRPTQKPTVAQLEERYKYLLDSMDCLRDNGIVVPAPPSLETYVESDGFAWVPHGVIGEQMPDIEAMNNVLRACPERP